MSRTKTLLVLVSMGSTLVAGSAAWSQGGQTAAASIALEEVVVTARKKQESLQDAPIAVTAISAEDVDDRQIRSIDDIARFAPGFVFSKAFGRNAERPVVRGLGSVLAGTAPGLESGTAYFVDGVYYPSTIQSLDLGDLERVEVIRGPQSALYGRNTYAGAVNFITRDPAKTSGAKMSANFDSDERNGRLRVEGALGEKASAALSVRYYKFDGQWTNQLTGKTIGDEESKSISGTISFRPTENVKLKFRGAYDEDKDGTRPLFFQSGEFNNCYPGTRSLASFANNITPSTNTNQYFCGTIQPQGIYLNDGPVTQTIVPVPGFPLTSTLTAAQASIFGLVPGSLYSTQTALPLSGVQRELAYGLALVEWNINGSGYLMTLDGGVRNEKVDSGSDSDHSALNVLATPANGVQNFANGATSGRDKVKDLSIELKLQSPEERRLRWMVGAYHYEQDSDSTDIDFFSLGGQSAPRRSLDIYNRALFGSLDFDFTDTISGTVELRRSEEVVGLYDRATQRNLGVPGAQTFGQKGTFKATTPRITVDWEATPDLTVYAVFAKGNKPGGFNGGVALTNGYPDNVTFAPEEAKSYEIGLKANWFERRLTTNVSIFKNDITNMQLTTPIQNASSGAVTSIVTNQGSGTSKGLELETRFAATADLTLGLNYSLADTEFTSGCDDFQYQLTSGGAAYLTRAPTFSVNYTGRGDCSINGNQFPLTSKHTASLTVDYERAAFDGGTRFYWNTDISYASKKPVQVHANPWTGAATLLGMRLGLKSDKWSVGLYGRNLTNEDSVVSATRWLHQFLFASAGTLDAGVPARFVTPPAGSGLTCPTTNPACVPAAQYSLPRGFFGALRQQRQIGIEATWTFGGD